MTAANNAAFGRLFLFRGSRMQDQESTLVIVKNLVAWLGVAAGHVFSSITLSNFALTVTSVYGALSAYVLMRDKILPRRKGRGS
ncbi:hypothetical protein ACLKMY_00395 [Paraburkholderia mimosarum]|uniref:hypothetical protein n=1 Tax=Paraburkholderia mimosarum TaxID=312026 RepID=UPI0039C1B1AE